MFTLYKDLKGAANREIQYTRDRELFQKMKRYQIPLFPMSVDTFKIFQDKFILLSSESPELCFLFIFPDDSVDVLNQTKITHTNNMDEAFRFCQDIDSNVQITVLYNKYNIG
jgi:hypothetical protein